MLCWLKLILRILLSALFIAAGVAHFVMPEVYVAIMPPYLPAPLALVYISGVFEILGGVGLFIPKLRRPAAWGLVALLIAVFPANIHMALHQLPMGDVQPSQASLWLRLPMQFVLIAWAYWYTRVECTPNKVS